jgi:hypothetical protein
MSDVSRTGASIAVAASALAALDRLPETVRVLIAALALALTQWAIEWVRYQRDTIARRRAELARSDRPSSPPNDKAPRG